MAVSTVQLGRVYLMKNRDIAEIIREWSADDGTRWIEGGFSKSRSERRIEMPRDLFLAAVDSDVTPDDDDT